MEKTLFAFEKNDLSIVSEYPQSKSNLAKRGTVFLDEISEINMEYQLKLLRFLEKSMKWGHRNSSLLSVRVILASSKNLEREIRTGSFREDLFYHINPITIEIPPLRSHKADIPLIADYYLKSISNKMGKRPKTISQSALDALMSYDWPGNVRELKNIIERALILEKGDIIYSRDFPKDIRGEFPKDVEEEMAFMTMEEMERHHILATLKVTGGNKTKAASLLNICRATLYEKLKHLDVC
jgi:DNA-binding NtrC family response regulator